MVGGQGVEVLGRVPLPGAEPIGIEHWILFVRHPEGLAVRPNVPGIAVPILTEAVDEHAPVPLPRIHRVAVDHLVPPVRHPHGHAVRPDAPDAPVPNRPQAVGVLVGIAQRGVPRVREEPFERFEVVPHPHGRAVRPEALGFGVPGRPQGVEVVLRPPTEGRVRAPVDAQQVGPRRDAVGRGDDDRYLVPALAEVHLVAVGHLVGVRAQVGNRGVGIVGDALDRRLRHRCGHAALHAGRLVPNVRVESGHADAVHPQIAEVGVRPGAGHDQRVRPSGQAILSGHLDLARVLAHGEVHLVACRVAVGVRQRHVVAVQELDLGVDRIGRRGDQCDRGLQMLDRRRVGVRHPVEGGIQRPGAEAERAQLGVGRGLRCAGCRWRRDIDEV